MENIHLKTIHSTQDYLKSLLKERSTEICNNFEAILVSCDQQTKGIGRHSKMWNDHENSLALSFTIRPNLELTLTTLEISVIIALYFKSNFNILLELKWPNDIFKNKQKVSGVLIDKVSQHLIVGVGINLLESQEHQLSGVFEKLPHIDKRKWAKELYQYILTNRLTPDQTIEQWNQLCLHINKNVIISTDSEMTTGVFRGIGPHGQARVKSQQEIKELYTGSLRVID